MQPVYPELVAARRCKLAVLGVEVGGRINQEACPPAGGAAKACGAPVRLRMVPACAAKGLMGQLHQLHQPSAGV